MPVPAAQGMPRAALLQHLSTAWRRNYGSCGEVASEIGHDDPKKDVVGADGGRQPGDARGDRALAGATWLRRDHRDRRRGGACVAAATVVRRRRHGLEHARARRAVAVASGDDRATGAARPLRADDRKSTRLNSSHVKISYAVFCLKKKKYVPVAHDGSVHRRSVGDEFDARHPSPLRTDTEPPVRMFTATWPARFALWHGRGVFNGS